MTIISHDIIHHSQMLLVVTKYSRGSLRLLNVIVADLSETLDSLIAQTCVIIAFYSYVNRYNGDISKKIVLNYD